MTASVDQLIQQAQLAEREGRRHDARALFERALYSLKRESDGKVASSLLRWIGRSYLADADREAALDCVEAAIAIAELARDRASIGHAINVHAIIHHQHGDFDVAESGYTEARGHAVEAGETRLAAMAALNLGVIAMFRGDHEQTLRYYRTSLAEFRTLGAPKEILQALNNMGMLCTDLERWDDASAAFEEAVQIADALGDIPARILLEVNRAELEIYRGNYAEARAGCELAMSLSSQTRDTSALGEIHKHLGTVARELGDLTLADEHLARAQAIAVERRDLLLSAETSREHAELCRRQNRHRDALMHLNRGHRLFSQLGAKRDVADIDRRHARLEKHFMDAVRHWSASIESKDRYTQGHCERVADISCALALRAGVGSRDLFWFRIGATVHDVGKLIIPSEILNKPGKLTPEEWELVCRHPVAGVEMLADMDFPGDVIPMVRSHHERWDGKGYPDQLKGEEIPRAARILCIADVYDALTSKRSYKAALTHDAAMDIMRADVGKQFDPELFTLFEEMMKTRAPSLRNRAAVDAGASEMRATERTAAGELSVTGPSDDLTGLLTRRPFVEASNKVLADRGPFATVSLVVIDVDEFKHVNDSYGHLQGDAVLRLVAGTLRELASSVGVVGRYAGDEFVILLPHTGLKEAAELAERIRATVRRTSIPLRDRAGSFSISLSIGVAEARAEHAEFDALFESADRALYEAKRRGRDTVVAADELDQGALEPSINLRHFVGREAELARLHRLLETTISSGFHMVSVVGEAGVGKSTLIRNLANEIRVRAGVLVSGRSSEADAKPPFAPWAEAIAGLHATGVVDRRDWRELPRLVPALGDETSAQGSKYAMFGEIVAYLRLAAAAQPIVVLLDDMQWSDSGTWDVLEHLASELTGERILVCITMRSEDTRGMALDRRNRLLRDERFHEINLARLSNGELEQWLRGVFGGDTSADLASFLRNYSEGNPLLANQLVRMLLGEGVVRYEHSRWGIRSDKENEPPPAVTGLMERRLERLSPRGRRVLSTAAVIGRVFDVDLAIAAGAGTEDEVLDALDEGIEHAVIEPTSETTRNHFSFTHGLLVDAVRRAINPRRVARIHERVAQAMEASSPEASAEIALHYDCAGIAPKAYTHSMSAGRSALAMYAHGDARRFFELAERAAQAPEDRALALQHLAEVAETEGRYALTEELCDRALADLAGRSDNALILALRRMRQRARAQQGQPVGETVLACRELLASARAIGERGEEAALLNMISQYQGRLGEAREAETIAREAVRAAEAAQNPRLVAEALTRLGTSILDRKSREATELYTRALDLFRGVGDRCGEARCHINMGIIHQRGGEVGAAEHAFDEALRAANHAHAVDLAGIAAQNLGVLHGRRGQLELAGERYNEALQCFTESSNESHRLLTLYSMANLARESEDWSAAATLYDQVMAVAARIGQPDVELGARAGQALAALAIGSRSVAEEALRWIRSNVEPRPEWWFQGRDLVDSLRIRLAAERGDEGHAMRLLHEAVAIAGKYDPYAAFYLVAECGPSLRRSADALLALIDQIMPEVEANGFAAVARRLSVLRLTLTASPAAA